MNVFPEQAAPPAHDGSGTAGEPRTTLHLEGAVKQAADLCRKRMMVVAMVFLAAFVVIGGRLVDVMSNPVSMQAGSPDPGARMTAVRGDIVDRNGVLLATSLTTASLFAEPRRIHDPVEAAARVAEILPELDRERLAGMFSGDRGFVWVKRQIDPGQQTAIRDLGIPGLGFRYERRRVYPTGALASHVVGFTDIDGTGLAGAEKAFDDDLRADREGPLVLSLDTRIQQIVHTELAATIEQFHAAGGTGIVLDIATGEVLAMVSLPDFNPAQAGEAGADARFNRASLGVYEFGSIFKVFTAGMALDAGRVGLSDGYDASRPLRVARFTISDYKPQNRWLSLPEILIHSSNIGAALMALDVGSAGQREFLERIGLLGAPTIELPETGRSMWPSPWRDINTMTIGFGHGIAVTPVQAVAALAAMLNGGTLHRPTIVAHRADRPPQGVRVISERTSETLRLLTHLVVQFGSGRKAQTEGYLVGGKTGTAEKLDEQGGYSGDRLLSSFVAAFPIEDPRYAILVSVDEPQGIEESFGYATGGWTAAPAVGRIIAKLGPLAGIPPHRDAPAGLPVARGDQAEVLEAILASVRTD